MFCFSHAHNALILKHKMDTEGASPNQFPSSEVRAMQLHGKGKNVALSWGASITAPKYKI